MKRIMVGLGREALWAVGLLQRVSFPRLVLNYHRFGARVGDDGIPQRVFAQQLDFLQERFTLSSLSRMAASPTVGWRRVAITVDDGYRSFLRYAWPELQARGLTATVFLPTQFISTGNWMWQDRNKYLIYSAAPGSYQLEWDGRSHVLRLVNESGVMDALLLVYAIASRLEQEERVMLARVLSRAVGVQLPDAPPDHFAPLSWEEVRRLHADGVEFGAHTVSHQILTLCSEEAVIREVNQSRCELSKRLGCEIALFAYPNGDHDSSIRSAVRRAGYSCAVSTSPRFWGSAVDPYAIPRVHAPAGGPKHLAETIWRAWFRGREVEA